MAKRYIPLKKKTYVRCSRCGGTGFEPGTGAAAASAPYGTPPPTCRDCEGAGKVEVKSDADR